MTLLTDALNVTPIEKYQSDLAENGFKQDPSQQAAMARLQRLYNEVTTPTNNQPTTRPSLLIRLTRRFANPAPLRENNGIYLWGTVGTGKSYLMDTFFDCLPGTRKKRLHFHHFMKNTHERLNALRDTNDPLKVIAENLATDFDVICLDEFQVHDIADAMILGNLFEAMMDHNMIFLTTSNRHPNDLYKNGLQRARFLPAIELIKQRLEIIEVGNNIDYRYQSLVGLDRYYTPFGEASEAQMAAAFDRLTGGQGTSRTLVINGRKITAKRVHEHTAWFDFSELCTGPRSVSDYIDLADEFHTLFISGVPIMSEDDHNVAKRFTNLIDELYDSHIITFISAEDVAGRLYTEGQSSFEFERTVSRLIEMQSIDYTRHDDH